MKITKRFVVYHEVEIPENLEAFKNWEFSSGGITGEDYKVFQRLFKKFIKQNLPAGIEVVNFSGNHYCCSGFLKKDDKFVYFSISDVRYFKNSWVDNILIRTAKSETDYTGGSNGSATLDNFRESVDKLFR